MSGLRRVGLVGINIFVTVVGARVLYSHASAYVAHRRATLHRGDTLAGIPGIDFGSHERTLVIAIRSGCVFAERSMPFYRRLAELRASLTSLGMVAILPDDDVASRNLLRIHDLDVPSAPRVALSSFKIHGTPALVLVDRAGTVVRTWEGQLPPTAESEVLAAIGGPQSVTPHSRTGDDGGKRFIKE